MIWSSGPSGRCVGFIRTRDQHPSLCFFWLGLYEQKLLKLHELPPAVQYLINELIYSMSMLQEMAYMPVWRVKSNIPSTAICCVPCPCKNATGGGGLGGLGLLTTIWPFRALLLKVGLSVAASGVAPSGDELREEDDEAPSR
ncbi:hypothetical protein WG66_015556 [Moniliophthora roreri]|nr:hypothetical protein WG66_015556 [Moniliophthora roreri]